MSGINIVNFSGNVVADPKIFSAGMEFRIACNERFKDKDGNFQDRTEYMNCVLYGPARVEYARKIISKGASVFVHGSMRTESFENKDGNKQYQTKIVIKDFMGLPRQNQKEIFDENGFRNQDDEMDF